MKVLLLLCVLVGVTVAQECDSLARMKVAQQWNQAFGAGSTRRDFGKSLWRAFFKIDPKARAIFERVESDNLDSPVFVAHVQRVLGGLNMLMGLIDDDARLSAALNHLNTQHDERGIKNHNFDTFKQVLMKLVPASLGRCFDEDAWSACYDVIANGIKHGA